MALKRILKLARTWAVRAISRENWSNAQALAVAAYAAGYARGRADEQDREQVCTGCNALNTHHRFIYTGESVKQMRKL